LTFSSRVAKSILEIVLALGAGIALALSLGYVAYAAPGNAVGFADWLTHPLTFSTSMWAVLGALIGLSVRQFLRGRRTVDRDARWAASKGAGARQPVAWPGTPGRPYGDSAGD
jgi:hypothetical protein